MSNAVSIAVSLGINQRPWDLLGYKIKVNAKRIFFAKLWQHSRAPNIRLAIDKSIIIYFNCRHCIECQPTCGANYHFLFRQVFFLISRVLPELLQRFFIENNRGSDGIF